MTELLVDIGANLTHDSFEDDRDQVIARASDAGIKRIIVTGTNVESSRDAAALARSRPGILYATAGMHPHHASDYSDAVRDRFAELIEDDIVVAVGECGLDYFPNFSSQEDLLRAFESQRLLAVRSGPPCFLLRRDSHARFVAALMRVIHTHSGRLPRCTSLAAV